MSSYEALHCVTLLHANRRVSFQVVSYPLVFSALVAQGDEAYMNYLVTGSVIFSGRSYTSVKGWPSYNSYSRCKNLHTSFSVCSDETSSNSNYWSLREMKLI